ncbi:hypothetical protein [Stygiolobus azoricus]|uniref:hypothetical protein n=1 Tax=Stygiolobus azoricus TaxID=41675 RepID=UPI0018C876D8|nr:hypothetical protein [Stygiolobus azoricus]
MTLLNQILSSASGLSSIISTAALIWTIYYYRKQTDLLKTQIDELKKQSSIQECLQMRDSTIRLHEVLTPLMIDEINEIYNFEELNKVCSSQVACMAYVHNIFSRQEEINEIREKIQRLLRDLKSLRLEDERFKNYEAFLEDIINSICNLPYSSKGGECELLSEIDQMKEEYAEIIKVIDVLLAEDVKGSIMSKEVLMKEVLSFKIEDLIDVLDKTSFLIDAECGGKLCKEVFPLRELVSGKMNPLKEMIEEPKGFCEKYGLKIVCEEYKDIG